MRGLKYVNMFNRGIQRVKNLLQENGNPEPVFNVDKITAFEVIVRPSLSLNLVTDEENVTKSVTKLSDTLNDIIDFCLLLEVWLKSWSILVLNTDIM